MSNDSARPQRSRSKIMLGVLVPLVVLLIGGYLAMRPGIRRQGLIEKGIHVPGRLIDVRETNVTVNRSPQLKLTIEFRRRDGVLDTGETTFVPKKRNVGFFQPGRAIVAAYDAADPEEVTLVDFADAAGRDSSAVADSLRRIADSLAGAMQRAGGSR